MPTDQCVHLAQAVTHRVPELAKHQGKTVATNSRATKSEQGPNLPKSALGSLPRPGLKTSANGLFSLSLRFFQPPEFLIGCLGLLFFASPLVDSPQGIERLVKCGIEMYCLLQFFNCLSI